MTQVSSFKVRADLAAAGSVLATLSKDSAREAVMARETGDDTAFYEKIGESKGLLEAARVMLALGQRYKNL